MEPSNSKGSLLPALNKEPTTTIWLKQGLAIKKQASVEDPDLQITEGGGGGHPDP